MTASIVAMVRRGVEFLDAYEMARHSTELRRAIAYLKIAIEGDLETEDALIALRSAPTHLMRAAAEHERLVLVKVSEYLENLTDHLELENGVAARQAADHLQQSTCQLARHYS